MYENSEIVSSMNIFMVMKTSLLGTQRMNSLPIDLRAKKHFIFYCMNISCLYPSFSLSCPFLSPNETFLFSNSSSYIHAFFLCVTH